MHKRIFLVAKAASGKDFLREKFVNRGFRSSVSYTTRPPRPNERDGVDYFFISWDQFESMKANDAFSWYLPFNNQMYATSRASFDNDDVFLVVPKTISDMTQEERSRTLVIFLDIDLETRKDRLSKRDMPGDTADRRLTADEEDFANFTDFDIRITNNNF